MASTLILRDSGSSVVLGQGDEPKVEDIFADDKWLKDGGLARHQIMRFLTDIQYEPAWRRQSDIDVDYFDNYQLSEEMLRIYEERGMPPLISNLIQPTINSVLGLEAKTRSDWRVTFQDDSSEQVALALNKKFNEAQHNAYANRACSDAYAGQVKAGLGWVEVTDNPHPLQFKYRVGSVHRREIWWDWRDTDPALDYARWLIRKKWFDDDVLKKLLPEPLHQFIGGPMSPIDSAMSIAEHISDSTGLGMSNEIERAVSLESAEWRDTDRQRSVLYEVWYRVWQESFVARLPNDRVVELNPDNVRHMQAVLSGMLKPMRALWPKMRQSFWLGPYRILDRWTPLPHQRFPYVPFWGFREDLSSMPYGLIRVMRSPQDEINARRSKMMALMSARRVQVDSDALDETHNSHQDVAAQASAHNHYIVLNPDRTNKDGLKIDNNLDLSAAQLDVLREAKSEIHETSGIFTAQQGETSPGMSGRAYDTLIDQGTTTLAEINDNYRFGRRLVGDLLLEHIKRDSVHEHEVVVGEGRGRKSIWLNQKAPDSERVLNDVQMSTARVELEEVPSTQGYRQQQFMVLSELAKGLPPELQQFIIDFVIEASDLPHRKEVVERIRKALNLPEPGTEDQQPQPLPPEVQQELAQGRELVQQQQAAIQDLSAKLQKAINAIEMENLKHDHKMAEIDATARVKKMDLAQQQAGEIALATANADAAASHGAPAAQPAAADQPGDDEVNAEALAILRDLAARVEKMEASQGPKRSIVKDRGDGTFEVLTVPVQQQAPLGKRQPADPALLAGAPA